MPMQLGIILVPTIFAIVCWSLGYATGIQSRYNKPHAEYTRGWVECERLWLEKYREEFGTGYAAANDDGSVGKI